VRSVPVAVFNGVVGDKPVVSSATFVITSGVPPAVDVAFVYVGDTCGLTVDGDVASFCQMKDVFVTVIDEALALDWFEMARADNFSSTGFHGNGFDPVKGVLQGEQRLRSISRFCEGE